MVKMPNILQKNFSKAQRVLFPALFFFSPLDIYSFVLVLQHVDSGGQRKGIRGFRASPSTSGSLSYLPIK